VNAIANVAVGTSGRFRKAQTGFTQTYAAVIVAAVSVILVLLYLFAEVR